MRSAWLRLDVPKAKRERLAELTGIPAPNLSSMNTGSLPMTPEMAARIAAAVPGLTVLDLGAPEHVLSDVGERSVLVRLQALEVSAVTTEDLAPYLRVIELLARGRRTEALRVWSETVEA